MKKSIEFCDMNKKDFEKSYARPWLKGGNEYTQYSQLVFFKGRRNGGFWSKKPRYPYYNVYGFNVSANRWEWCARMDDMNIGSSYEFLINKRNTIVPIRMDCNKAGCFRFWGAVFHVGNSLSSTEIQITEEAKKK